MEDLWVGNLQHASRFCDHYYSYLMGCKAV